MRKLIIGLSILFSLVLLICVGVNSVVPFLKWGMHANERQRAKLIAKADIDNLEKMLSQYEMMVGDYYK